MIQKRFAATLLIALAISTIAWAVPAKRIQLTHTQSDGTTVTVTLTGDERHHSYATLDGLRVELNDAGDYCYVAGGEMTKVVAHDAAQRGESEKQYVESNKGTLSMTASATAAQRVRAAKSPRRAPTPHLNSPRIPIILANFQNIKFKADDPIEAVKDMYIKSDKSALNYFTEQSRGKFTPQFDVVGLAELKGPRKDYGGNVSGQDRGLGLCVKECIEAMDDDVDWSVYDNDGDGEVEVLIVLYAGPGEAQGGASECIWPCQWYLKSSEVGQALERDGVFIDRFAMFNELYGRSDDGTQMDGLGTFIHEFSHCLGLPDFYPTNYSSGYGMDAWSVMDYGCYNDDGYTPVGYTAYEKDFLDWVELEELEPDHKYTLRPMNQDGKGYMVVNDKETNGWEYYVVEDRVANDSWDKYLDGEGMLVTHVYYSPKAWSDNTVNNDANKQRMTIIPADNRLTANTNFADPFPYKTKDMLTDDSTPKAACYVGGTMGKPITNITRNADKTITFLYMRDENALRGDVNGDGVVDIADVNCLINIILGVDDEFNYNCRALVTEDLKVDIADVNQAINIILGQ